ncbi:Por secretion system C-terminal sorting domain-containing protein [Flavobacterium swingsii]|uniref:Por secretion system C-terminal sorting domain-containing protein n=1 Tax=Flavobacterium swingsii TaxID=498292 RepID=A0A1I0YPM0_9FLAO|nr:T9SS type A sorting domain-containing protein [Flavobacterium swingsii]SFB15264.1 Por secretion system C-terminal sorting domain-containing protein [Flavobacterium swingsii]
MKKNLLLSLCAFLVFTYGNSQTTENQKLAENNSKTTASASVKTDRKTKILRKKHAKFLANSPFKKTLQLSKEDRKAAGLPPNKYYERQWELSINPATGNTEQTNVLQLQKQLDEERLTNRTPGDASDNNWVERGPTNVGGRTRVLLFDPNDATNKRVFAGAASGGLWVKTDITTTTAWTRVAGVPGNLNVSCITVDPNNSNIWYLGTGEQYTSGDAVGNGVYKTSDGGTTWVNVPVSYAGTTFTSGDLFLAGIFYVQDIIAWNNAGNTEIFIGVGSAIYGSASPNQWSGAEQAGLYKSVNGGTTWTRNQDANMVATASGGKNYYVIPNDLEKDALGNLWFSSTRTIFGTGGGRIYKSTNGTTWTLEETIANARRTELEPSSTNANKFYVLYQTNATVPAIGVTTDAFATAPTTITQPDDADTGIAATDFTRGQAFYDLMIECDPTNDAILYIGGIDLFRSTNSGGAWTQISKWSNNNNLAALTCSLVHADQHVMSFRPGASNEAVFGNDGGVFYASNLSSAGTSAVIPSRNASYNVTQFYSIGVAPTTNGMAGDNFVAGAQDNGSQMFLNAGAGAGASAQAQGGDGAYSFFDQNIVGTDRYRITNYVYNLSINLYNYATSTSTVINNATIDPTGNSYGDFICPMGLDSSLDILYSDYTTGSTYQIRRYADVKGPTITRTTLTNALLTGEPTAFRVSKYTTASTTLLVGCQNGRLLLVTNADGAAPTWTNITGASFVGSISDVEFGATENDIFVTFHNYGVVSVWYSANRGVTWQNKEGNFPNIPVKCILQNPLNPLEVIIGTDLGVWYTNTFSAASPTWNQSYNGMSDVKVTDLQVRNDNAVYAATYGRGVFSGVFTSAVLSVNENEITAGEFNVYPTVNNGNVTISSSKYFGSTKLNLFDMTGKNVYSNTISLDNSEQKINLGNLSSGNYILKISGNNFEATKKLIINN